MSKEKTDSSIELNPISNNMEKTKNISMTYPAVKAICVLSACAVVMSSGSANGKIVTGIKNEVIEYKNNSAGTILYPFYKVLPTKKVDSMLTQNVIQETKDYGLNMYTSDVVSQKIIIDLRKEIAMLKNRLGNSLPVHTLIYMIISSIVGAVSATLLIVRYILNVHFWDPYYLICAIIISFTLFMTALVSLKDWKNFLNER